MVGKIAPDDLAAVLARTGAADDRLLQGPAYGEDAAAIEVSDGTLVVSSDPISLAATRVGTLGVHVACNDVAASGADPRWLTSVVFVPRKELLDPVTEQLDAAATDVGATIIGGHTEIDEERDRPLLSLTCIGPTDRFVPTGGAQPGDRVLLTKGAAIEATGILATDFGDELDVDTATLERAESFFEQLSVVPDARVLRDRASAMHDPTEGGVLAGLYELAAASEATIAVDREAIPIHESTATLCRAAGVDPLRVFGSGALLATVPDDEATAALGALDEAGIDAAAIGTVEETDGGPVVLDGEAIADPVEDEMYRLWER